MREKNFTILLALASALNAFSGSYSLVAAKDLGYMSSRRLKPVNPSTLALNIPSSTDIYRLEDKRFLLYTPNAPLQGRSHQAWLVDKGEGIELQIHGQTGRAPWASEEAVLPKNVRARTTQALRNVKAIIQAAGGNMSQLTNVLVILKSRDDRGAFDEASKAFFDEHHISPTMVRVSYSDADFLSSKTKVEIKATAYIPKNKARE